MKTPRVPASVPRTLALLAAFGALSVAFQNCSGFTAQQASPTSVMAAQCSGKAFRETEKVRLRPFSKAAASGAAAKRGDRLLAFIDLRCADNATEDAPSKRWMADSADRRAVLSRQAFSIEASRDFAEGELEALVESDPCLLSVSRDEPQTDRVDAAPTDPAISQQTYLADLGWASSYDYFFDPVSGIQQDVIVAVVDSGVETTHSDLRANLWRGSDGIYGYDVLAPGTQPDDDCCFAADGTRQRYGHGTKAAGIIGGVSGNGIGLSGVMAKRIKIMPVRFVDASGTGSPAKSIDGIQFALDHGADVMNMSFGSTLANATREALIRDAVASGVVMVAAAGNSFQDLAQTPYYPAVHGGDIAGMLTVGGTVARTFSIWQENSSSGSNYGSNLVEISAQAKSVYATATTGVYALDTGTSFAAPIVSGAAALVIGMLKTHSIPYTPALVEDLLKAGSIERSALSSYFQNGRTLSLSKLAQVMEQRYPQTKAAPIPGGSSGGPIPSGCGSI